MIRCDTEVNFRTGAVQAELRGATERTARGIRQRAVLLAQQRAPVKTGRYQRSIADTGQAVVATAPYAGVLERLRSIVARAVADAIADAPSIARREGL